MEGSRFLYRTKIIYSASKDAEIKLGPIRSARIGSELGNEVGITLSQFPFELFEALVNPWAKPVLRGDEEVDEGHVCRRPSRRWLTVACVA